MARTSHVLLLSCALCVTAYVTGAARQPSAPDAAMFSDLRWRHVGPFRAGRVNAVSGAVGQPNTF